MAHATVRAQEDLASVPARSCLIVGERGRGDVQMRASIKEIMKWPGIKTLRHSLTGYRGAKPRRLNKTGWAKKKKKKGTI